MIETLHCSNAENKTKIESTNYKSQSVTCFSIIVSETDREKERRGEKERRREGEKGRDLLESERSPPYRVIIRPIDYSRLLLFS